MHIVVRRSGRFAVVGLLAMAALFVFASAAFATTKAAAEEQFVDKINAERKARGLGGLTVDVRLTRVAREWSAQMAASGQLSHRPNLAAAVGGDWQTLAENVGRARLVTVDEPALVERLHQAFMDSPGHRANVLGPYDGVGVGVTVAQDGTMWVTVNFISPSGAVSAGQVSEGVRVSRGLFGAAGSAGRQAPYAVVARADVFADALGGSGLAADRAPVLFTPGPSAAEANPVLHPGTRAEIDRVLGGRGVVYLLGGTGALPASVASELAAGGYTVKRLAGASRVETAVAVAEEILRVHGPAGQVLIARADDWPDALSGGAFAARSRSPLLVTGRDSLHPAVASFLQRHGVSRRWALGGSAALSEATVRAAKATRVAGADRAATSVAVAERLWGRTSGGDADRFVLASGWGERSWAYALAHAPWSAVHAGPQLLVNDGVPPAVGDYLARLGYRSGVQPIFDRTSTVPSSTTTSLTRLLGL